MRKERKTEVKVGITVIVSLILLIWIFGWAKNFSLTSDRLELKIAFKDVSGLEIGDQVTVNGLRSGYVEDINIEDGDVIVLVSLDQGIKIYSDADFEISMLDLMGGKKVNIDPGTSEQLIETDELHRGTFNADIPEVMALVGTMGNDLPRMMKKLDSTLTALNSFLQDKELSENIKRTLNNFSALSVKLNRMVTNNEEDLEKLLANSIELTDQLNELIVNNKEGLAASLDNVNSLMADSKDLVKNIDDFLDEVKNAENNAGKLLYDEDLVSNLKEDFAKIRKLITVILEQLEDDGVKVDADIF